MLESASEFQERRLSSPRAIPRLSGPAANNGSDGDFVSHVK